MKLPKLDIEKLRMKAEELVREQARRSIPGEAKAAAAVEALAEWVDDALEWGPGIPGRLAEWADGRVARVLLGALVQEAYVRLEAADLLGSP